MTDKRRIHVLMVCLGNICRSPTAHAVMEHLIEKAELNTRIAVDSAGTGDWHIGKAPDKRSQAAASQRGYDLSSQRARQVSSEDFERFDYIVAMDDSNIANLTALSPPHLHYKISKLTDYVDGAHEVVPDPYYGDGDGFELVLNLVEEACQGLLDYILADIPRRG